MPIIDREHKLLFIMPPGTGCTAVGWVMRQRLGAESLGDYVRTKHHSIRDVLKEGLLSEAEVSELYTFSTVRNPFDLFCSDYLRHKKWKTFYDDKESWIWNAPGSEWQRRLVEAALVSDIETYLELRLSRYEDDTMLFEEHWKDSDFVMRYESLEDDFNAVLTKAGISEHISIPQINATDERLDENGQKIHYSRFHTETTRALIEHKFNSFMKKFNYSWNESE